MFPGLNLIEHVRDFPGCSIAARKPSPTTIDEFKSSLRLEWMWLPQGLIRTLAETLFFRKKQCHIIRLAMSTILGTIADANARSFKTKLIATIEVLRIFQCVPNDVEWHVGTPSAVQQTAFIQNIISDVAELPITVMLTICLSSLKMARLGWCYR
ncbi:hypothetical protein TNCV_2094211 [Trichonephila clavipes]|nr:hypothetical protein TNCV_2094211 [Trichonephila clavipes]